MMDPSFDVADLAERARSGELRAARVFDDGYAALAATIHPWLGRFGAEIVVIGGSIARSWDLIERWLISRWRDLGVTVPIRPANSPDESALIGAAQHALVDAG